MRWEDCVNRDLGRVEGEWRTKAKYSRNWGLLIENALGERSGEETWRTSLLTTGKTITP